MIDNLHFPSKHQKVKKCEKNVKTNSGVVSTQRQKNVKMLFKKNGRENFDRFFLSGLFFYPAFFYPAFYLPGLMDQKFGKIFLLAFKGSCP